MQGSMLHGLRFTCPNRRDAAARRIAALIAVSHFFFAKMPSVS
jgi:hypothetical protein